MQCCQRQNCDSKRKCCNAWQCRYGFIGAALAATALYYLLAYAHYRRSRGGGGDIALQQSAGRTPRLSLSRSRGRRLPIAAVATATAATAATATLKVTEAAAPFPSSSKKLIVAWTPYFTQTVEEIFKNEYLRDCGIGGDRHRGATCAITSNRSRVRDAVAVVFHARDVNLGRLPPVRVPGQAWILFNFESPVNARITTRYDGLFNLTMTYRNDSDLPVPYGWYFRRRQARDEGGEPAPPLPSLAGRKLAAYWLVSNCAGERMSYVRQLRVYFDVDVFGGCTGAPVPRSDAHEAALSGRYAFYLAFENSRCTQYVTEKLWKTLKSTGGAIPVAMGATLREYEAMAPPGSFLHVDNFTSPAELGAFLRRVASSELLFATYHTWRRHYVAYGGADKYRPATCQLCERAGGDSSSETAQSVSEWFNAGCSP